MLEIAESDEEIERRLKALERDVLAKLNEIQPVSRPVVNLFTPAQLREIAWRRGESA